MRKGNFKILESFEHFSPGWKGVLKLFLGFDNPTEVAEYLNLSVDTVYVYKARIKSRSIVDKDEFDSRIMAIPKP